ncbi:hypothetical protein V2J09_010121 [Rumex salicifolius]
MASRGAREVTDKDIQLVHSLIKQCIRNYMDRAEAVNTIWSQAKIDQCVTELVWQKLEEENKDFFEAYNLQLELKNHIYIFNELLRRQAILMNELQSAAMPIPNGSHITYMQQNSECYTSEPSVGTESVKQENLDMPFAPSLPLPYSNGMSPMHGNHHTAVNLSTPSGNIDANALSSSHLRMMQGMNGGGGVVIKPELDDYSTSSQFIFDTDAHILETSQTMGNDHIESYTAFNPQSQSSAGPNLEDLQFSFSELSANFPRSDLLGSCSRQPFLGPPNFLCSPDGGELQDENGKLANTSEHLNFEDFGKLVYDC